MLDLFPPFFLEKINLKKKFTIQYDKSLKAWVHLLNKEFSDRVLLSLKFGIHILQRDLDHLYDGYNKGSKSKRSQVIPAEGKTLLEITEALVKFPSFYIMYSVWITKYVYT
jgi:hypothetical protein